TRVWDDLTPRVVKKERDGGGGPGTHGHPDLACNRRTALGHESVGDARRTEDLESVVCRGRHHRLESGGFEGCGWKGGRLGGLGKRAEKVLESGGLDHEEE